MAGNGRIRVRVSAAIEKHLRSLAAQYDVHIGQIVEDALRDYFTPPEERPYLNVLARLDQVDDALERVEAQGAFQTDLLVEFIFEWLKARPLKNPLWTEADDARVKAELRALTNRVVEQSRDDVWN